MEWGISESSWCYKNFVRLLCGWLQLPVVLLQNPKDDDGTFEDMIRQCDDTLGWLSRKFKEIGLSMEEVIIMEMCPLFSNKKLQQMGAEDSQRAIRAAYDLTVQMLRILQPAVIITCQCATRPNQNWRNPDNCRRLSWGAPMDHVAYKLGSSTDEAKAGRVVEVDLGNCLIKAVRGMHPATRTWNSGTSRGLEAEKNSSHLVRRHVRTIRGNESAKASFDTAHYD